MTKRAPGCLFLLATWVGGWLLAQPLQRTGWAAVASWAGFILAPALVSFVLALLLRLIRR